MSTESTTIPIDEALAAELAEHKRYHDHVGSGVSSADILIGLQADHATDAPCSTCGTPTGVTIWAASRFATGALCRAHS